MKHIEEFEEVAREIELLTQKWELMLRELPEEVITQRRNRQNRTIKQILGHMVDSASNNTHRIVHFHYQPNPMVFPDYANLGNNDRWIAIQNYQEENWENLVQLWKYANIHLVHLIRNVNPDKSDNEWATALNEMVSMKEMITDYPRHFKLHVGEMEELINQ
ncbi:MAG TPA: DinB family protein [Prolixibacteraceae bacterium]|nr:DinB family protein [Prolixibacteraceae bacterium]